MRIESLTVAIQKSSPRCSFHRSSTYWGLQVRSFVRNHTKAAIAVAFGVTGSSIALAGDNRHAVLGVVVVILSGQLMVCDLLCTVIRQSPGRQMFERGWELGEHKGYEDGRRSVRPVVVPMRERVDAPVPFFSR